jgi:hypothetical protein
MSPVGVSKEYEYFIVVLTKQGRLIDWYVTVPSIADALDKFIGAKDLAGNVEEYKFCIRREKLH